jgi:hypothetical protein
VCCTFNGEDNKFKIQIIELSTAQKRKFKKIESANKNYKEARSTESGSDKNNLEVNNK